MNITYDDFKKVELRTALVKNAERVAGSDKLLRLTLDAGDKGEDGTQLDRQVIAGIGKAYEPEVLLDKTIVIVANLEPRSLMGLESNGMLVAASGSEGPIFLTPERDTPPGASIQ